MSSCEPKEAPVGGATSCVQTWLNAFAAGGVNAEAVAILPILRRFKDAAVAFCGSARFLPRLLRAGLLQAFAAQQTPLWQSAQPASRKTMSPVRASAVRSSFACEEVVEGGRCGQQGLIGLQCFGIAGRRDGIRLCGEGPGRSSAWRRSERGRSNLRRGGDFHEAVKATVHGGCVGVEVLSFPFLRLDDVEGLPVHHVCGAFD